MTIEEAAIVLLAAVAGILLFLGLAQALEDRPPRRRPPARRRTAPLPGPHPARPVEDIEPAPVRDASALPPAVEPAAPAPLAGEAPVEAPPTEPEPVASPPGRVLADPATALVEACMTLYQNGKYSELLALATPYLRVAGSGEGDAPAPALAALWSLVGTARQAVGDAAGARAAFDAALREPAKASWPVCPERLAAAAVPVARRFLEMAERAPEGTPDRLTGPRLAALWLGWRLGAVPGERSTAALLEHARERMSEGHSEVAGALIRRQDFAEAHRLIQQGMEAGELPGVRGETLLAFLSDALIEEIGRLTTPAIRGARNESQAVVALETAQALLAPIPDRMLAPAQRLAVRRRLWRGYAKLGMRRLKAGEFQAAAEVLFQAHAMTDIDVRRQRLVRDALVRSLEAIADETAREVARLLGERDRQQAQEQVQRLILQLQRAREEGISREELGAVAARSRQLTEQLERAAER